MATFLITKKQNENYKFEFNSRKGKTIFTSIDFELRYECEEFIAHLKENIDKVFFMKFKSGKKYYAKLILNEKEIAKTRKYTTVLLLEKGISEIENRLSLAEVLDFSFGEVIFDE